MVIKKVSLDIVIGVTSRLPETDRPQLLPVDHFRFLLLSFFFFF